ncbi:MAG: cysteine desulfurase [Saprospiraceae bacterium]|nr:cysteine desulfurase [Saprospiraceae bacterium]
MKRIYLDNAASTPMTPEVLDAVQKAMSDFYGNPSSIHAEGRTARSKIEESRKKIARHFNASIGEIFFTSGGTESNNTALKCAVRDLGITRIITTSIEHHAITHSVSALQKSGVQAIYLSLDEFGQIELAQLEDFLKNSPEKTLVSIMHANNEIGTINDIVQIADIAEKYGAYLHTDAVQTVGHLPLDLQNIKVHFLSASAHKFHGPKGVGILYIRQGVHIKPLLDGGGQERNMRGGTEAIHNIIGLATALDTAIHELDSRSRYIQSLKTYFKNQLAGLHPDIRFNGPPDLSLYTVLSVSFPAGPKSELLLMQLDMAGVSASGGSACSSGAEAASHVLQGINHPLDRKTIRFSFSHLNTFEEIDQVLQLIHSWYPVEAL